MFMLIVLFCISCLWSCHYSSIDVSAFPKEWKVINVVVEKREVNRNKY